MAGGRPTKLTTQMKKQLKFLAGKGFTEKEMAEAVAVDQSTITKWKQRNPSFFTSLKEWKVEADRKVERSLYERACGYTHPEVKVFCNAGEVVTHEVRRHYPPDPTAMIFWLKNRKPDEWRDRQDVNLGGSVTVLKPDKISKPQKAGA